jgi:hypothetical protein
VVKSDQPAGNCPLGTRHRLDKTGKGAGNTETYPMTENRLGNLLETLEFRGTTREHHTGPWYSIQPLTYQYLVNSDKEIARALVEDLGGKGCSVHLVAVSAQRRHLDRRSVETFTIKGGAIPRPPLWF